MKGILLKTASWIFIPVCVLLSFPQPSAAQNQKVNIEVTGTVLNDPVPSGDDVIYNFVVSNIGPTTATEVVLVQDIPRLGALMAAAPSVGYCHTGNGTPFEAITSHEEETSHVYSVYCVLGDLLPYSTANVTITVKTAVFGNGIDLTPVPIDSMADISANEEDFEPNNDHFRIVFNSIPSPNKVPVVRIIDPAADSIFKTSASDPVEIPVHITASDPDGSIVKVGLYGSGIYLGEATALSTKGSYTFNFTTTETRRHLLTAIATDNDAREAFSNSVEILVNSPHTISITKPSQSLIAPGTGIDIETESNVIGNKIQKIELFDTRILLGKMSVTGVSGGSYKHRLTLPSIARGYHRIRAVLTDLTGATSVSPEIEFKVTDPPSVSITSPIKGASFPSNTSVYITVQTDDPDGYVKELEFYASGRSIGTQLRGSIKNGKSTFRWISPDDGEYVITVKATDDTDEAVVSDPVTIRIAPLNPTGSNTNQTSDIPWR
jgi:hypothetical protein